MDILETYLTHFGSNNAHTQKAKELDLRHFYEFLMAIGRPLEEATKLDVERFVDSRLKREAPATVNRRLATIKHFSATACVAAGLPDFAKRVKGATPQKLTPKWLDEKTLEKIIRVVAKRPIRDQILFELLAFHGLRRQEACDLEVWQFDGSKLIDVRRKGCKYQTIFLRSETRRLIKKYLATRTAKDTDPLLADKRGGGKLTGERVYQIVRALHPNIHPHILRHTFVALVLKRSNDLLLACQAAGHSDPKITMRYALRTDEQLQAAMEEL